AGARLRAPAREEALGIGRGAGRVRDVVGRATERVDGAERAAALRREQPEAPVEVRRGTAGARGAVLVGRGERCGGDGGRAHRQSPRTTSRRRSPRPNGGRRGETAYPAASVRGEMGRPARGE